MAKPNNQAASLNVDCALQTLESASVEKVEESLQSENPIVRLAALEILEKKVSKQSIPSIKHLLKDCDKKVSSKAAFVLLVLSEKNHVESIYGLLFNKKVDVAKGAALFLGRQAKAEHAPALLKAFAEIRNIEVAAAIVWSLGQCKNPIAVPLLVKAIQLDYFTPLACESLGKIGDLDSLKVLTEALAHQSFEVRSYAARSLGLLSKKVSSPLREELIQTLERSLIDDSRKVRLCSAVALHELRQGQKFS